MKNLKKPRLSIPLSIMLVAITSTLGITPVLVSATPSLPVMTVVPAFSSIVMGSGTSFTVYVQVPNNPPTSKGLTDLRASFIVQTINNSLTSPDGTVIDKGNLVTCTTAGTHEYPRPYPSRYASTSCSGQSHNRVDPRAYTGSTTAIDVVDLTNFAKVGTWTVTFTVVGLYYLNNVTLTASAQVNVGTKVSGSVPASSSQPTLSVVPGLSVASSSDPIDYYVYVQVPNNPPVTGSFYDLQPAFVLQTISEQDFFNGTSDGPPEQFITCTTATGAGGYPSSDADTSCTGIIYEQRVIDHAYWGTSTGIWFLGLVAFFGPGTFTVEFTVTGLYYGNTITLDASTTVTFTS